MLLCGSQTRLMLLSVASRQWLSELAPHFYEFKGSKSLSKGRKELEEMDGPSSKQQRTQ